MTHDVSEVMQRRLHCMCVVLTNFSFVQNSATFINVKLNPVCSHDSWRLISSLIMVFIFREHRSRFSKLASRAANAESNNPQICPDLFHTLLRAPLCRRTPHELPPHAEPQTKPTAHHSTSCLPGTHNCTCTVPALYLHTRNKHRTKMYVQRSASMCAITFPARSLSHCGCVCVLNCGLIHTVVVILRLRSESLRLCTWCMHRSTRSGSCRRGWSNKNVRTRLALSSVLL
jgi:hypothetical protein